MRKAIEELLFPAEVQRMEFVLGRLSSSSGVGHADFELESGGHWLRKLGRHNAPVSVVVRTAPGSRMLGNRMLVRASPSSQAGMWGCLGSTGRQVDDAVWGDHCEA